MKGKLKEKRFRWKPSECIYFFNRQQHDQCLLVSSLNPAKIKGAGTLMMTHRKSRSISSFPFNTSYLTDSYIIFILKMESVCKIQIFGLKMMVKSGLEKIFLKFLHAGDYFSLLHKSVQNHKFSNKNNHLPAWRDFKINFSRPLFTIIFRPKIVFLDTDSILRVKPMYESVK